MFSKILLSFLFIATAVHAAPAAEGSIIHVRRDMTDDPTRQDVQDFGCIVTRGINDPDRTPWVAVSGGATGDDCAKFKITREGDFSLNGRQFRFQELSTGKLMKHNGDWIYLDGEPNDKTAETLFIMEDYVFWNDKARNPMLRPSSSSNRVYAQYDSGDLNTKNSGFKMFVSLGN
ncbi:hypothetical protein M413DRAFT_14599 [Hebeloma cylindrosporum]|uniref:Uncharacterized protein n=1 Tax=Hebeloma cylindrosporum TaxID=76867 RepID=A0A0C3BF23_HEBCY|nr:hypothetical protein M413DRAFT_14599 [Hebeloma cylindrosporum h7]